MANCYAVPNPSFYPAMRLISAITKANPAQVTTTFAHSYLNELIVRIDIPFADGMQQLNGQIAQITVTSPTTFTIPIDTTSFDAFAIPVAPPPYINTCAQVVPVGENTDTLTNATINILV